MRNLIQYPIEISDLLGAIKFAQHSYTQLNAIGGTQGLSLHMLEEFLTENTELVKQFCERKRIDPH